MKLEVGMYVRFKGKITKLETIAEGVGGTYYYFEDAMQELETKYNIGGE